MNENPDAVPQHEGGVDYRIETRLSRIEHWRIAIEIAALIVAAAWGLYVFVYQERIKPALAPALLEPNISVTHTLTASGQEFVALDCELKNIGATEVRLVGVAVSAYGTRFAKTIHTRTDTHAGYAGWRDEYHTLDTSPPELLRNAIDLFAASGHGNRNFTIAINGDAHQLPPITFGVLHGKFDILTVRMQVVYVKATDRRTFDLPWRKGPDGSLIIFSLGTSAPKDLERHQITRQFPM
jgi:hypothetical protein